jgi:UDP-glucose 4-epimerase
MVSCSLFFLLEALRRRVPACRVVLLSSAAVYGNPPSLPVNEAHPIAPLSPYGYHKRQCELLIEEFARLYAQPALACASFPLTAPDCGGRWSGTSARVR